MQSIVLRGADIKIYINGIPFPPVTSLKYEVNYGRHSIYTIDELFPQELAPGQCSIRGTLEIVRTINGNAESSGICAPFAYLSMEKYFSITVMDRRSSSVIFQIDRASASNQSWQVAVRSLMSGTISFEGLTWENETA